MSLPSEARAVLLAAEQGLRALVEKAARDGRYDEVVQLAEAAQQLRRLAEAPADLGPHSRPAEEAKPTNSNKRSASSIKQTKGTGFPKFEVDGDRLVKIGWSKRERSEYQHKTSREAALCTFLQLGKEATTEPFRMEDQLPVLMADGTAVPTYQSYLVLAWLRQLGWVEKVGKDSYRWAEIEVDETSFKSAWESTIRRSSQTSSKGK